MSYSAEISRNNPSCFLFVIDQSGSMDDVLNPTNIQQLEKPLNVDGRTYTHSASGQTKSQGVANAINRLLQNLIIRCAKNDGIRDFYHVGVIGYGNTVGSAFSGSLAGQKLVAISDIANNPARVEERTKKTDDGAGGLIDQQIKFPVWFEPVANGGTPMCQALTLARTIMETWLADHPACFPPIVIHISDGESTDGDAKDAMHSLTTLCSSDGNILLFNLHLSANKEATPISFPDPSVKLPDEYANMMFAGASPLTQFMRAIASEHGFSVNEGAKGFVLNGDLTLIIQALDIGTRASNLR